MTIINLPFFGEIDITQLKEYYSTKTEWKGSKLQLSLMLENNLINEEQAKNLKTFLENIEKYESQIQSAIKKDFNNEGETVDYINFYLDEFDQEELSNIVDINGNETLIKHQLINRLKLISVMICPDEKYDANQYGIFDFSIEIDGEPCNQLLVVKTNKNGEFDHITWES